MMLNKLSVYAVMFREKAKEDGFWKTLGRSLRSDQEAVPAVCDLLNLKPEKHPLEHFGCEIRHISQTDQVDSLLYELKSRKLKVKMNIRKGYQAFVLIKDGRVIGDLWFTYIREGVTHPHRDVELLGIDLGPHDAYAFDLFVSKQERGKDLTTTFMIRALKSLGEMGFARAYGYYMAKNIPALWIHRLIGYKEMPRVMIRNVLFFRTSKPIR